MQDRKISVLGEQVLLLRKRSGWTQAELAEKAGLTYNTITRLERGVVRDLKGQAVARLADVFGVSTDTLMGRDAR